MLIPLSSLGNPELPFISACAGRAVDLSDEDGAHLLQIIPARWRSLNILLGEFVDELATVEAQAQPDGEKLIEAFRRVIYDATEIFDCYANLLPNRVKTTSAKDRIALKEYRASSKRMRDFTANLCNRCKHAGAQLQFLWAVSTTGQRRGARVLVQVFAGGDALIRDDRVHKGQLAGLGIVRIGHELAHNLLRIDHAAAKLIDALGNQPVEPMPSVSAEIPIGPALRRLSELTATRHSDECSKHDGLAFRENGIELTRVTAEDLGPNVRMTASLTIHQPTVSYGMM